MAVACVPRLWPHRSPSLTSPYLDSFLPWGSVQLFSPLVAGWGLRPRRGRMAGHLQEGAGSALPSSYLLFLPGGSSLVFQGTGWSPTWCSACYSLLSQCPVCPFALSASVWSSLTSHLRPLGLPAAFSPAPKSRFHPSPLSAVLVSNRFCFPRVEPCRVSVSCHHPQRLPPVSLA